MRHVLSPGILIFMLNIKFQRGWCQGKYKAVFLTKCQSKSTLSPQVVEGAWLGFPWSKDWEQGTPFSSSSCYSCYVFFIGSSHFIYLLTYLVYVCVMLYVHHGSWEFILSFHLVGLRD